MASRGPSEPPPNRDLRLHLGDFTTDVTVAESGLRARVTQLLTETDQILVFDENTAALFAPRQSGDGSGVRTLVLPPGEAAKSFQEVSRILDGALDGGLHRQGTIAAVGGGALTDAAGLAASLYMRGVRLLFLPTTLLAMVDAAIGGKTGINYGGYKNMVGTFYPAHAVEIYLDALDSLSDREVKSGLAEVIKAGLLGDEDILRRLEAVAAAPAAAPGEAGDRAEDGGAADARGVADAAAGPTAALQAFRTDRTALADVVERAVAVKIKVVEQDFRENGIRAHLNLGHTFAHALESVAGLGRWTHGEAVAWGICRALDLGVARGTTDGAYRRRVYALLSAFGFHTGAIPVDFTAFVDAMRRDKKAAAGAIRFVLQRGPQDTFVDSVEEGLVREVLGT